MARVPEDNEVGPDGRLFKTGGRLGRMVKMGGLAAQVAGSAMARGLGAAFKTEDERAQAVKDSLVNNAQKVVKTMGEMKGAAMKLGQMLSVAPDGLPKEFLDEMRALQKSAPPMGYEMVAREIERALNRPLHELFRTFDPTPIGAASIGQVHRAKLFDGREVAVKVQYPGIAATLEADLKNLGSMLSVARVIADRDRLEAYLGEVRQGILEEADYLLEAKSLKRFGAILSKHPKVVVPEVIDELSAKTVLTMSYLEGQKLDLALESLADPAERNQLGIDFSEVFIWMFHEEHILHADPHPGNYLLTPDHRFGILDFGCVREYEPEFCDGWLDVLVAKWTDNDDALPEICKRIGFKAMGNSQGLDGQQLSEFNEIVLAPFMYDREFDWGAWQPQKGVEQFVRGNLGFFRYAAPPKAVFYFRVCAGIWGFLKRLGVRGNYYRLAREIAERHGRIPTTVRPGPPAPILG